MGHRRISRHTFLKFSNQMAPAAVMDDQSVDGGATLYALPIIKYIQYMNEYLSSTVHQGRSIFKCAVLGLPKLGDDFFVPNPILSRIAAKAVFALTFGSDMIGSVPRSPLVPTHVYSFISNNFHFCVITRRSYIHEHFTWTL